MEQKQVRLGVVVALVCLVTSALLAQARGPAPVQAPAAEVPASAFLKTPRNVIILIGDGMGYNHVTAVDLWQSGTAGSRSFESFPVKLGMRTSPHGAAPYDPIKTWAEEDFVRHGATDSAASATAMACGAKTTNGAIGLDPDGRPLVNVMQAADAKGKATGVVTSVQFSHATPAGFVAHNPSRNNYAEIAEEMILRSHCSAIMGGGHPDYDGNGQPTEKHQYKYVGGEDVWDRVQHGQTGGDGLAPWALVETRAQFQALANGPTPPRVLGVAPTGGTLQQGRSQPKDQVDLVPFGIPLTESEPTLAELTSAALNVLDDDPDGLCLMVEGGAIDWAGHGNDLVRVIEEGDDFGQAIDAVIAWVEAHSNWDETLVIVTADHETGYLTGPSFSNSAGEFQAASAPWPLVGNGPGKLPGAEFHYKSHTNNLVPFYAKGCGANYFRTKIIGSDPHRGQYLDNISLGGSVKEMWK